MIDVVARLPAGLQPYGRLARWDRPVGIWLLLLPCLWSLMLAGGSLKAALLFLFGSIVMRGAGCTINDILDRDIDAKTARTASRPLAAGEIGLTGAFVFLMLQLILGFAILLEFNKLTIYLGIASLPLIFLYPLMKRITWWPQAFLGITFNWGALMGWTAATEGLGLPALLLYAAGVFWTLAYDTIYAHQDAKDDLLSGVKSTALHFGNKSRLWITGFYFLSFLFLALSGFAAHAQWLFYLALIFPLIHMIYIVKKFDRENPRNCLACFKDNVKTGILVLIALALA